MKMKKYELIEETIEWCGCTLHRIRALRDFGDVKADDMGGYIESEDNLSHDGDAWVFGNACVSGNARVFGDAQVSDNACVSDNAWVYGKAWVYGDARVYGDAQVFGNAQVYGKAWVFGNARVSGDAQVFSNACILIGAVICKSNDYIVLGPIGSRSGIMTFYRAKGDSVWVKCGCFNDTIDAFAEEVIKVHGDDRHGRDYAAAIEFARRYFADGETEAEK